MRSLVQCLPLPFPAFAGMDTKTYAAWPVWSDSTTKEVSFQRMPKKVATRLYHRARDFDRKTSKPGCHGGAVGPTALKVLETLIFDFLNYASGRLDPSYDAIARKANVCRRAVATALTRLKELGLLHGGVSPNPRKFRRGSSGHELSLKERFSGKLVIATHAKARF